MKSKPIKKLSDKEIEERIKNLNRIIAEIYDNPCFISISGKDGSLTLRTSRYRLNKIELYSFKSMMAAMKNTAVLKINRLENELKKRNMPSEQEKCHSCNDRHATELHVCPFLEDIHKDETKCNCCEECKTECFKNI